MEPYGITIFCDDIRFEQHGKYSVIGCYGPDMIVSEFPALLPKFACLVQLRFPATRLLPMTLKVYFPGDAEDAPGFSQQIHPGEDTDPAPAPAEVLAQGVDPLRGVLYPLVLSPLPLQQPGRIKVRVSHGDKIIRAGTLVVKKMEITEQGATNP